MAIVENAGINVVSSNPAESYASNDIDQAHINRTTVMQLNGSSPLRSNDETEKFHVIVTPEAEEEDKRQQQDNVSPPPELETETTSHSNGDVKPVDLVQTGVQNHQLVNEMKINGGGDDNGEDCKNEMMNLEEMFSKLNPLAKEFVPPSLTTPRAQPSAGVHLAFASNYLMQSPKSVIVNGNTVRRKKNSNSNGKRTTNSRTSMAQQEDAIRKTVYVSDIHNQVTEEQLATFFLPCGHVVDCRICGDPKSVLRFAFVEFTDEEGARNALSMAGALLCYYPVRILPSKTAIAPVNPTFLPRSEDEREMCSRTIYCTNIDKKITQADVKLFFESFCGEVYRLRLLGDYHHSTRIAFVEFVMAESAIAALNCSGAVLGSLAIRVSPSKTPVRPRAPPRAPMQ
ncbi:polyadenylate-binding protein-interacting protein 12-like [Impatiens glandulifera]|uniref:polyadenylate-binding protein-interacting protein 12-like n=1 Tax=Impatiens glandulifera TaxID=253017 RepID=UPI001FB13688|nr:polyadenylate-binding protein-interacting protein 12-like [Impatiens glandulifera]